MGFVHFFVHFGQYLRVSFEFIYTLRIVYLEYGHDHIFSLLLQKIYRNVICIKKLIGMLFKFFSLKRASFFANIIQKQYFRLQHTAVSRKMFDLPFYSSKTTILRVIGGAEGVLPHPHKCGSK